jgi:hypothetical protein
MSGSRAPRRRTFDDFEREADRALRALRAKACRDCGTTDEHETWCPVSMNDRRLVQVTAQSIGHALYGNGR